MRLARAGVLAGVAVVCVAGTLLPVPVVVSTAFALVLVLVLPGYALCEALDVPAAGFVPRLVLVPALSIAAVIVVTLVVDLTPPGLTTRTWSVGIAVVVIAAAVVGSVRGRSGAAVREPLALRIRAIDLLAAAVAIGVLIGAVALVRTPLAAKQADGYTQLSLVRRSHGRVLIEVQSRELRPLTYRLVVRAGGRLLYGNPAVRLEPGGSISKLIKAGGPNEPVRAMLYVGDDTAVYRRVNLR